jgi:ABC-type sugar transport system ATPase subunit
MGRALVREPAAFLLDEPLSNLDPRLRVQVRAEIQELQTRTRTTMIYVTHDQVEAMTLGHRVAVMDRGRLQQVATPRDLYDQPANVIVAGFIGSPPMNLFPAHFEPDPGKPGGLRIGACTVALPTAPRGDTTGWTAGVRPEGIDLVAAGSAANTVPARIDHIESLGHETLVHVRLEGDEALPVVARVPGMPALTIGQRVGVVLDPAHMRLFDVDGRLVR